MKSTLQYPSDPILSGGEAVDSPEMPEEPGGAPAEGEAVPEGGEAD